MNLTEHQIAYAAAVKTLLPQFSEEQCINAMLTHFTCGEERDKAYESLGRMRYNKFRIYARNQIHIWDRFAVYDQNGKYLTTVYTSSHEAIDHAKRWHPSCKDQTHLTTRRLGLLETDPFYLP